MPATFPQCVTGHPPDPPLDATVAGEQHAAYARALEGGGFRVHVVAADDAHPDCSFIEDTAVVLGDAALVARLGHPSRRGEVGPVAEALRGFVDVEEVTGPATLDGGDVLRVGSSLYVGVGDRTNPEGFAVIDRFAARRGWSAIAVTFGAALHLKSAASAVDEETVLVNPRFVDPGVFDGVRVVELAAADPGVANVVRLPDGSVLVAAHHEETSELLTGSGRSVVAVEVGEFARADGGVTCLSLRIR